MPPPSVEAVRETVGHLVDDAVRDVTPLDAGKNAVYAVALADRRAILKVGTATPDRVRAEPALVDFVATRTDVPVPTVVGAAEDRLAHPYCLYERVPGRTVPDRPDSLSVDLLARVCEEAGRYLGTLHDAATFDRYGQIVPDEGDLAVPDGQDEWTPLLGRVIAAKADAVGDRFGDLRESVREYARRLDEDGSGTAPSAPSFVHMDYRPANLVLDPDCRRATRAVLDWSGAAAAPPGYEFAHAEALLTDWPRLDEAGSERLRDRFRAGYAATNDVPTVPDPYRVDARLRLVKHFGVETADLGDSATAARAADHRRALASLGVPS